MNTSKSNSSKKMSRKSRSLASAFEGLEARRLMDATPYVINGTAGNDVITVNAQTQQAVVMASTRGLKHINLGNLGGLTNSSLITININGVITTANVDPSRRIRINGLDGNDRIQVIGSRGMDLCGNAGNDTLIGGDGPDLFAGNDGKDTVDYSGRMSNLNISIDNVANDGRPGEGDNVSSSVEEVDGGLGNDYISAATITQYGAVTLMGNLGNDTLIGSAGWDYISGGAGDDLIHGGAGRDIISGDAGNDVLYADSGNDAVFGGTGDDRLYSGTDNDELMGGLGNDTLVSIGGGQSDELWGGSGVDSFWLDSESTEKIPDFQYPAEMKTFHRVAAFDDLHVNGQDAGVPSRDLLGQNLPNPTLTDTSYSYCHAFSNNPLFAPGGPSANDIVQGNVGDCYFMAPLSAIARSTPDVIRQSVVDLGDGTFAVDFHDSSNVNHFIRVDGELPVDRSTSLVYAKQGTGGSIWVPIMEKAWAFYRHNFGSYSSIDLGYPSETFTATGVTYQNDEKGNHSLTDMLNKIVDELSKNEAVTICTKKGATSVVESHCYMVANIIRDHRNGKDVTLVVLRNPWGHDGPGADSVNDGYVTIEALKLFADYTRITASNV